MTQLSIKLSDYGSNTMLRLAGPADQRQDKICVVRENISVPNYHLHPTHQPILLIRLYLYDVPICCPVCWRLAAQGAILDRFYLQRERRGWRWSGVVGVVEGKEERVEKRIVKIIYFLPNNLLL